MAAGIDSEPDAGAYLDRLVELRVFGRKPISSVPAYSTDENAADLVIARLNRPPLRWMSLQDGDSWTFHWRKPIAEEISEDSTAARYARLVSASAPTRALAVCRAALKLVKTTTERSWSEPSAPPPAPV
ncbi:MAG TPA: hypothetical protein VKG01_18230 [Thermoanaerobaculia bacterium]|nr:hypothetical protein [Thermoanaerobaculia bacterium]